MTATPSDFDALIKGQAPQEEAPSHEYTPRNVRTTSMALNLTSMIDVIFQLLIYFVITASFSVGEGVITAKLPSGSGVSSSAELPKQPLNIVLQSQGGYEVRIGIEGISEAPANFSQLAELLGRVQFDPSRGRSGAYKPDNPVIIKPDGQVRWQHVVNAFNAAVKARYENVSFAQAKNE